MMPTPTADQLIDRLGLTPLPWEGGYYRETWRADVSIPKRALGASYASPRNAGTAIYYLLTPDTLSRLHRLPSDEVFHFYLGDPVELIELQDVGISVHVLGPELMNGHEVQHIVKGNTWFGARLLADGSAGFALMGTTVAPGFDFDDLEMGEASALIAAFPHAEAVIRGLT